MITSVRLKSAKLAKIKVSRPTSNVLASEGHREIGFESWPVWFVDAVELEGTRPIEAMTGLATAIDIHFAANEFSIIDRLLFDLSTQSLSDQMLVGLLSSTFIAAGKLPHRMGFFDEACRTLKARGRNATKLIGGLSAESTTHAPPENIAKTQPRRHREDRRRGFSERKSHGTAVS